MNSRGQESATFELLVVAIMGLAIMLIVLGIADYFSSLGFQASERALADSLKSAVNAPNSSQIVASDIRLNTGSKTVTSFSKQTSIPAGCFSIDARSSQSLELHGITRIDIKEPVELDIFIRCVLGPDYESDSGLSCEESCLVSFGKEIRVESAEMPA